MNIDINGMNVNYQICGQGKDLVLLHGWGAEIETFRPVITHFSKYFRVIAVDLPGFGKTPAPYEVWKVSDYSNFTLSFISALGISEPILLGHSFGGRIIIYLTGKKMIKARKIILVDSAGIKPKRKLMYYLKVLAFKLIKNILMIPIWRKYGEPIISKARNTFGSDDYRNSSGVLKQIMVNVVNEDLRHLLPNIETSTLLIWGDKDTATPVCDGRLMEKLIPDSGLVLLQGAGHFSYLDKNREFNLIVENFLREDMMKNGGNIKL